MPSIYKTKKELGLKVVNDLYKLSFVRTLQLIAKWYLIKVARDFIFACKNISLIWEIVWKIIFLQYTNRCRAIYIFKTLFINLDRV